MKLVGYPIGPGWSDMSPWEFIVVKLIFVASVSGRSVKMNIVSCTEDLVFVPGRRGCEITHEHFVLFLCAGLSC